MPVVAGNNIIFTAGETITIEVNVLNERGEPATNIIAAKFAIQKGVVTIVRDCTISSSTITVNFTQEETLQMEGDYEYEFRVKADVNDVDRLIAGRLRVEQGIITSAI